MLQLKEIISFYTSCTQYYHFFQLFRHMQGMTNAEKHKLLTEAVESGVESATKKAKEAKSRGKLRDYFVHAVGVNTWTEAQEKFPKASGEVENFVGKIKQIPSILHMIS